MGFPSPFEVSRATGNNLARDFRRVEDNNAIESILAQAMASKDPQVMNDTIGQILSKVSPERQGTAIQFLQSTAKGIQDKQMKAQEAQAAKDAGTNSLLPPAVQAVQVKEAGKNSRINQTPFGTLKQQNVDNATPQNINNASGVDTAKPQQGSEIRNISDDDLVRYQGHPDQEVRNSAKAEATRRQEERKIEQKKQDSKSKRNNSISEKTLQKAEETALQIPQKRAALKLIDNAIVNKDLSFWSRDNLAELTGIEGFRSSEGAIFKTAGKEYFLGNITRAGARPNQWIEQQIADMMQKVGRSPEANLSVSRALENELDLDEERVRLTNEIADSLEDKLGYVPRDLAFRVNKELASYADKKQKELFNDLRAIKSIGEEVDQDYKPVEPGTAISKVMAKALFIKYKKNKSKAEEEAKKLGYIF